MSKYSYNCTDKSIILPYFKQYYVRYYFKLIPQFLTANLITIFSSLLNLAMLYACYNLSDDILLPLILCFCINGYVVGDHLDGMQAKETKTGSALGEFLDHYFDVYNGSIILLVTFLLVGISNIPKEVFYFMFWLNFLAFGATMTEELETGSITFGKIGTLEGLVILIFVYLSWSITPIREFWNSEMVWGYSWYWAILVCVGLGYLITTLEILIRIRMFPGHFFVFTMISFLLVCVLILSDASLWQGWLLATLLGGEYTVKVLESHLLQKKSKHTDFAAITAIIILCGLAVFRMGDSSLTGVLLDGLTLYLIAKVIYLFTCVFTQLRQHWHWVNPHFSGRNKK